MRIWDWTGSSSGNLTSERACLLRRKCPRSPCRAGDGPRHFHFHPNGRWLYSIQEEGSTIVLFDYDAGTGRLPHGRRSPPCRPALPGVTSAPRSWFLPTAGSSTLATGCMTASGSSPSVPTAPWPMSAMNGRGGTIRAASTSTRPAGSCIAATSEATTWPSSASIARPAALHFTGHYGPVGNPSSIVFLDLAKAS